MQATHPTRASSVALAAVSVYLGGWGIYYAAQDSIRRAGIRSRRRRFPLQPRPSGLFQGSNATSRTRTRSDSQLSASSNGSEVSACVELPLPKVVERAGLLPLEAAGQESGCRSRWYGHASQRESHSIFLRFAPMSVLGRYVNPFPEWRETGAWEFLFWKLIYSFLSTPRRLAWDGGVNEDKATEEGRRKIDKMLSVRELDALKLWGRTSESCDIESLGNDRYDERGEEIEPSAKADATTFTWLGQSTCLIQMNGVNVLTDPVFGVQPVESIFSPTRMRNMPCTIDDLTQNNGRLDVILISHNHFDHLDLNIISKIPRTTRWVVPFGVGRLLSAKGVLEEQITELAWWQRADFTFDVPARKGEEERVGYVERTMSITGTPAMHWTGRSVLDVNRSLWCSYLLRVGERTTGSHLNPSSSFFFCCDSGYSPLLYSSIGRALGPVDAAAIPIGSYSPRWFMSIQHCNPADAVQMAMDLGAKQSFATHWGTWSMSDERWDDPPKELGREIQRQGLSPSFFRTVAFGEIVDVKAQGDLK